MRKLFSRILFVTVFAFIFGFLLHFIIKKETTVAQSIGKAIPDTYEFMYMREFYSWYNNHKGRNINNDKDSNIVLVELDSLEQLPKIIETIDRQKPRAIGLDVLLSGDYNDSLKQSIAYAAKSVKDKLVLVCDGYHGHRECSYFVKDSNEFILGSSAIPADFWHYSYLDESTAVELDSNKVISPVPHFPWVLAEMDNIDCENIIDQSFLVNYERPNFEIIRFDEIIDPDLSKSTFNDKIVIIGYLSDPDDWHSVPFQSDIISGIEMHACALQSVLDNSFFKKLGKKANFFLNLIIVLLYSSLYVLYIQTVEEPWKKKKAAWIPVIFRPAIIFSFVALMYLFSFIMVTKWHCRIPEISLATIAIAMIDFMDRLYNSLNSDKK